MCKKETLFKQTILIGGRLFPLLTDNISQLKEQERFLQAAYLDLLQSYNLNFPIHQIDRESVLLLLLLNDSLYKQRELVESEVLGVTQLIKEIIITIDSTF